MMFLQILMIKKNILFERKVQIHLLVNFKSWYGVLFLPFSPGSIPVVAAVRFI